MTAFSGAFAATITPAENTATMTTAKSVANFFIPAHPLPVCGLQREIAPRAPFGFLASAQIGEPLFDFFEVPAARPGREPLRPPPAPPPARRRTLRPPCRDHGRSPRRYRRGF